MSELSPKKTRILVADDDPQVRSLLQEVLESAGYAVDTATNGREALNKIRRAAPTGDMPAGTAREGNDLRAAPDLVLLDVDMPEMSGWEVVQQIKSDTLLQHLPTLMLTSLSHTQHKIQGLDLGADDYLTKPFNVAELLARVRSVLKRTSAGLEANPLTRLPGNNSIEREINARIRADVQFMVLYADLNHFKAFNDRYGFARGDHIIQETSRILLAAASPGDFVGHVGGDDFIVVTLPERAEKYCNRVIAAFDAMIPEQYDPSDRARAGIDVADRLGNLTFFPFVGLAIGGVSNVHRPLTSLGHVSALGAEMKKFAKRSEKSAYAFDRRTD